MGEIVKREGISQSALGRALDLSPPAITKLKQQGMPVHSVDAARAWRLERQSVARRKRERTSMPHYTAPAPQPPALGEGAYQAAPDYNTSRARREAAEAQLAELRLAEERGDLVRASVVRAAVAKRAAGLREALLQLPARVVPMLVASPDAASMDKILRAEIVVALAQLTENAE
jgi:phage terminase Nu1 subunit (DNA packaging protein)